MYTHDDDPPDEALRKTIGQFITAVLWTALGFLALSVVMMLIAYLVGYRRNKGSPSASTSPLCVFQELLLSLFSPEEMLRTICLRLRGGEELIQNLPAPTIAPAEFFFAVVRRVRERGLCGAFFDLITEVRAERRDDIQRVRQLVGA